MSFILKNVPQIFQCMVDNIFSKYSHIFIYIDDIIIFFSLIPFMQFKLHNLYVFLIYNPSYIFVCLHIYGVIFCFGIIFINKLMNYPTCFNSLSRD